jgi:hypothetical protein
MCSEEELNNLIRGGHIQEEKKPCKRTHAESTEEIREYDAESQDYVEIKHPASNHDTSQLLAQNNVIHESEDKRLNN